MRWLALVTLLTLTVSGCGVPIESGPRPIPLPNRTAEPAPSRSATTDGAMRETLYLVRDGRLSAVERTVAVLPSPADHLGDLLAGPTGRESRQGLTSALLGTGLDPRVVVKDRQAVVELGTGLEGTGRTDDILAFAQLVCTLTSRPDVTGVVFTRAGHQIEVPRADSSLTRAPLSASDYASLLKPK